jgi:ribose transport system ATP-binding protein
MTTTTSTAAPPNVLVDVEEVHKSFPGTQALAGVSLHVRAHEIVGIVGENGAGKSTLLKILAGIEHPDSGTIRIGGQRADLRSVGHATRRGISMVSQEGSLIPNLSVAENVFLGHESRFVRFGTIDWRRLHDATRAQLERVGADIDPRAETWRLSFGERQMVELARVLALQSRADGQALIILDEPTSVLSSQEIERLFTIMRELRSVASLIFVSHRLDEVMQITDRIYVLRDGKLAGELETAATQATELQRLMVGRELHLEYYRESLQSGGSERRRLSVDGLSRAGAFEDVSFDVSQGEIVGLCGVLGSGTESVLRTLAGLERPSAGRVTLDGEPWSCADPHAAIARGIGYIPAERGREGLVLPLSVAHNLTLPRLDLVSWLGLVRPARERSLTRHWVERLRIRCPAPNVAASSLSGGNQQKIVLAKWLAANVKLLVLDHPTRGIDVGAKEDVYELLRTLTAAGLAIVLVSDTLEEAIGLSDRLVCMRDARVTGVLDAPRGGKPSLLSVIGRVV